MKQNIKSFSILLTSYELYVSKKSKHYLQESIRKMKTNY